MCHCDCFVSIYNTLKSRNCQPFNGNGEQICTNSSWKDSMSQCKVASHLRGCRVSRSWNWLSWYIIKFVHINCIMYSDIWIGNDLTLEGPKKIDVSFKTSFVATKGAWKVNLRRWYLAQEVWFSSGTYSKFFFFLWASVFLGYGFVYTVFLQCIRLKTDDSFSRVTKKLQ
jgi:hypothetical protein